MAFADNNERLVPDYMESDHSCSSKQFGLSDAHNHAHNPFQPITARNAEACPNAAEPTSVIEEVEMNDAMNQIVSNEVQNSRTRSHQTESMNRHPLDRQVGMCTEAIYKRMREDENTNKPDYNPNSEYLQCRGVLVDWMVATCETLKICDNVLHVACAYLDRMLLPAHEQHYYEKQTWQILALICLRIAGKFEEAEEMVPPVQDLCRFLPRAVILTPDLIRQWDLTVLHDLKWDLKCVRSIHFVTYFVGRGVVFVDDKWNGRPLIEKIPRYLEKYCIFFANLSVQDYYFQQFSTSLLAAAIICAARKALALSPTWRPELEEMTGFAMYEFSDIYRRLWELYSKSFPSHAQRYTNSPKSVADYDCGR